jgi:hypothetical protein
MVWRQRLSAPPHPCYFVMPRVCLVCVSLSYYLLLFEMNLACICVTVCVQWTTGVMYSCDDPVRVCVHVSVVQLCAVERGERGRNRLRIPPWLTTAQPPRWDEAGDRSHAALEGMHVMLAWRLCVQSAYSGGGAMNVMQQIYYQFKRTHTDRHHTHHHHVCWPCQHAGTSHALTNRPPPPPPCSSVTDRRQPREWGC